MQHGGKELSYLNLYDTEAAWRLVQRFDEPGRGDRQARQPLRRRGGRRHHHAPTCGPTRATRCRPSAASSPLNRPVPLALAEALAPVFTEVVVAPGVRRRTRWRSSPPRRTCGCWRRRRRGDRALDLRSIDGGLLVQEADHVALDRARLAGGHQGRARPRTSGSTSSWPGGCARPSPRTPSCWCGTARPWASAPASRTGSTRPRIAAEKAAGRAAGGAAPATPSSRSGTASTRSPRPACAAVIQPGGSVRDDEVIAAADEHGIAMVFTGERHFRH